MFLLFVFALLLHGALSVENCKNGQQIVSEETKNPLDIIGNWSYLYHWNPKIKETNEFDERANHSPNCPVMKIEEIAPDYLKAKEEECAKYEMPFNWADAKLTINAPLLHLEGAIITIGEKDNWLIVNCSKMVRVVLRKVCNDYILMTNPDINTTSELLGKVLPSLEELKSVAHNIDVLKGVTGMGVCYKP